MGLLSAVGSFRLEKNIKFFMFTEICIENRMKSLLVKENKSASPVENIDDLFEINNISSAETPESVYLCKEYFPELFSNIRSILSPAEFSVFNFCLQGLSYRAAAEELGITEKSVDNVMQRARRKIRTLMRL